MSISGVHVVVPSADPEADRVFFQDVLKYPHVDAGGGWLIFKLPPAEVAVHPGDPAAGHELYLMCDDIGETMTALRAEGVECQEITDARWGRSTRFRLPGGSHVGLYEPRHPRATDL
jgi:catechol 2,3-dioxygenase-like lactoylglutathione lyase family enzyme